MKIKVGQIWLVTKDLPGEIRREIKCQTCGHCKRVPKLETVPVGSFIEIRYPFEWHYRTTSDDYFHSTPAEILARCSLFGQIHEEIRFGNKHKLAQILAEQLYTLNENPEEK